MNRSEFIKRMGAAALIPFVPNRRNYIDSTITLVTKDNPLNYRTVVHAYDMTLETVMDEYTPYDNASLEYGWEQFQVGGDLSGFDAYRRTMTLSNLPDNYDKYELSVWKTTVSPPGPDGRSSIFAIDPRQRTKVFSRTYDFGFPPEVWINLHIGQQ